MDNSSCVIVLQATPARLSYESLAARDMIERYRERYGYVPQTLAADNTYGNGELLQFDFTRNALLTSTQVELDLRLLKYLKVGEHGKLDFVVESFNVLNHTNVVGLNQFFGPANDPFAAFNTPNRAGIARQLQFSIDFEF